MIPFQTPILHRFGDMFSRNAVTGSQIGNRARNLQNAIMPYNTTNWQVLWKRKLIYFSIRYYLDLVDETPSFYFKLGLGILRFRLIQLQVPNGQYFRRVRSLLIFSKFLWRGYSPYTTNKFIALKNIPNQYRLVSRAKQDDKCQPIFQKPKSHKTSQ